MCCYYYEPINSLRHSTCPSTSKKVGSRFHTKLAIYNITYDFTKKCAPLIFTHNMVKLYSSNGRGGETGTVIRISTKGGGNKTAVPMVRGKPPMVNIKYNMICGILSTELSRSFLMYVLVLNYNWPVLKIIVLKFLSCTQAHPGFLMYVAHYCNIVKLGWTWYYVVIPVTAPTPTLRPIAMPHPPWPHLFTVANCHI